MSMIITTQGEADVIRNLQSLSQSVQKRMVARSALAALKPVVKTARQGCPKGTGNLRKSIGVKKVKRQPKGQFSFLVGARPGYKWAYAYANNENDPVRYIVPVEYGHRTKGGGFVPPVGMLRAAYNQHRVTVIERFAIELKTRIETWNAAHP